MKKILIAVSLCMAVCLFAGCGKTNEKLDEANKQIEELSGKINTLVTRIMRTRFTRFMIPLQLPRLTKVGTRMGFPKRTHIFSSRQQRLSRKLSKMI